MKPQDVCLNGPYEKNQDLIQSYYKAKSAMKDAFLAAREKRKAAAEQNPEVLHDCNFSCNSGLKSIQNFANVSAEAQKKLEIQQGSFSPEPKANGTWGISEECLIAALKRNTGKGEYACQKGRAILDNVQCYNQELMDYVLFAVNQGLKCLSTNPEADAKTFFKKFNDETGFHFGTAYSGGHGLGGMTSIGSKEVATHKGTGKVFLQKVIDSQDAACKPFQDIAKRDLENPPDMDDVCSWVSPEEGLVRNILYSISLHLDIRDNQIAPEIAKKAPALLQHPDLMNTVASVAYGASGVVGTKTQINKNRVNPNTDPKQLKEKLEKNVPYLQQNQKTLVQALCIRDKGNAQNCNEKEFSKDDLEGKSCIQKY